MKILVTGADGFVGSRVVLRFLALGHEVGAAFLPEPSLNEQLVRRELLRGAQARSLDLLDVAAVDSVVEEGWDAVVHLAAVASGSEANRDPDIAWRVNTLGTVRLVRALANSRQGGADPLFLFVSTAEVYGASVPTSHVETDNLRPCSQYAATKLAAEVAVLEANRRTGLRVVVARPFPHTGAGQDQRFVVPAFARRVLDAKRQNAIEIKVGNLDPVRDFLHVDDVVDAYALLLESGESGAAYNVASGRGVSVKDLLLMVSEAAEHPVNPKIAEELVRPADVPHLVGNSDKLRSLTGWQPKLSIEQAVQEVVNAQTG